MGRSVGKTVRKLNGRKKKEQLKNARSKRMMKQKRRLSQDGGAREEEEDTVAAASPAKQLKTEEDKCSESASSCEGDGSGSELRDDCVSSAHPSSSSATDRAPSLPPLDQFSLVTLLSEDPASKTVAVAGHFPRDPALTAVVVAEKTALSHEALSRVFNSDTKFSVATSNSIYGQVAAECGGSVGDLRLLTVYPATEGHLLKYSRQVRHVIHESPQVYERVTRPFIESQSFNIQWVFNILEGREEQDRVVYQDPDPETGFVLLPDFKWDQRDLQNLYLLAICRRRNICSLRDLRGDHLPLLRNILEKGQEAIYERYGIPSDQLRVYVHYQPSYYHLHVHFTQLSYNAPKSSVGDAHLLRDIIANIETFDPEFYQKCRLSFTVSESCLLWKAYQNYSSAPDQIASSCL